MYNINSMDIKEIAEHMNSELKKGRTQKDIEINDFGVNEKVVKNRLDRKGYKKIDNQWILNNNHESINTTKETTEILQSKEIIQEPSKKAFNNDEIKKLEQLLNIDLEVLNKMINEYTTNKNTKCSIEIKDDTTTVTSLRVNKEIYSLIKEKAQIEGIGISEIMNKCMINYLN